MTDKTIKVLGVIPDEFNGLSYVRFIQPFEHLRQDRYELQTLATRMTLTRTDEGYVADRSTLDGISLLIFPQLLISPILADGGRVDLAGSLCREARQRGIPVVFSVDDDWSTIEEENPEYHQAQHSTPYLNTMLEYAEAIFVTTPVLEASFRDKGKNVHLLPNCIDPNHWGTRPKEPGALRIGWAGSGSHIEDLRMILPALKQVRREIPFTLHIFGLTDIPIKAQARKYRSQLKGKRAGSGAAQADAFVKLNRELGTIDYRHTPYVDMQSFFGSLAQLDLDLGLCPLRDTPFNRSKSALKFYEYAMVGTCSLASAVTPYKEEMEAVVENTAQAWTEQILRFAKNRELRDEMLYQQRAFVLEHRNIQTVRASWKAALSEVLRR